MNLFARTGKRVINLAMILFFNLESDNILTPNPDKPEKLQLN